MAVEEMISHLKEMKPILRIQTVVLKEMQSFMVSKGFVQLLPIVTSKFTDPLAPDPGSSVIFTPSFEYYSQKLVITQSMILHKQLSLIAADKIFIFSPNVRLEKSERGKTGRHAFEFTQMDFEMAYAKMKDVMDLVEDLVIHVIKKVKEECKEELDLLGRELRVPSKPFKVYRNSEVLEKYGSDDALSEKEKDPFWIIDIKREFYDKEDEEHPGHYLNYDLILPEGYGEVLSGGEREYKYERIMEKMKELEKEGRDYSSYKNYLEVAKMGLLKPSAGGGIGVERLLRFLTGKRHIRDVQLFPRIPGEEVVF
jgi:asparaginyl-tRNA synthetase